MKAAVLTAIVATLLCFPTGALALGTEQFGNAPAVKQPGWAEGVLAVVNLESRVYSQWVNGNENFFYRGNAQALNETLRKYATVKADQRRLVLLPGRGMTRSFGGKPIDFGWQLHVPSGIYLAVTRQKHAVLTVYVDAEKPRAGIDRKTAEKWVAELNDDSFEKRQNASHELEKLGAAVKPLLRETLKGRPSVEVHRRIDALLAKLGGIEVEDLEVPQAVTVVTASDLLEEHFEGLKDTDPTRCGLAMHGLSTLAPYSDKVVPTLTGLLQKGNNEYTRRVAASCLGRLGTTARSALAVLKKGGDDPDNNVRAAFQAAVEQIEKAREEPGWGEELKKRRAILKDIEECKKAREKKPLPPTAGKMES